MTVLEWFVAPKGPAAPGEDMVVATPDFVAVIDGSTTPAGPVPTVPSPGRCAAEAVAGTVVAMPADTTLPGFLDRARTAIVTGAEQSGLPTENPTATAAVLSVHRREVWLIGDVTCSLTGPPAGKPSEKHAADVRASVLHRALADGATVDELRAHDPGREAIREILDRNAGGRNTETPDGFACLCRIPTPLPLCRVVPIGPEATELHLCSDGYPDPGPTLADSEENLRRDLREDPLRIGRHRATKGVRAGAVSFDDRAYVRVSVPAVPSIRPADRP